VTGPPSLWQEQSPWEGFPPLDGDAAADVVVVGAGVTGCACALRLARGGASVLVLEARRVAAGASGRNGGFASAGTGVGLDAAARAVGMSAAVALHRATESALDEMLALGADRAEAVRRTGSLWLATSTEADGMAAALTALVAAGVDCREAPELIPAPMRARYPHAAVFPGDCELHPARWARALAGAAAEAGAHLREHSPARAIERCGDGWRVATPKGAATGRVVVVAIDGLLPQLVPELRGIVYPVRGQMLATEPIPDPVITMPTHCEHGFVYARPTLDGRLAIGGCRSADLEAEYTDEEGPTPRVQEALDRFIAERIGLTGVSVSHRWAGTMGFSADLLPVVGEVPGRPGLHVAGGYSGVGNVQGFVCGGMLADRISARPHPLAAVLAIDRFAVGGRLRPAAELREQRESRRLRDVLPA
jgi:gamma-glutamylputrescine oxidase